MILQLTTITSLLFFSLLCPDRNVGKEKTGINNLYDNINYLNNPYSNTYDPDAIKKTIAIFKTGDIDAISSRVKYPLKRQYPLKPIANKEELRLKFNDIFDQKLLGIISNSTLEQWQEVGWRGLMLNSGLIWMANADGIITAINYESPSEEYQRKKILAADKSKLHLSLKNEGELTYTVKTKNYIIRIDQIANEAYRYAAWKKEKSTTTKPDLILKNGMLNFEGNGGNHVITFENAGYTYNLYRHIISDSDADFTLQIEKDNKIILTEDGTILYP